MKDDSVKPPRQPSKWDFLDYFNSTSFKGWSVGWLWIYTGGVWGLVAVISGATAHATPTEWLLTWLGGLTAYSGVSYFQNKSMRETDYGYVERKGAGNVPATVVQAGAQVQVAAATTAEQPTK